MSRHKLVKNLDLDKELDDFDGGIESDDGEEVSLEDQGNEYFPTVPDVHLAASPLTITLPS